MYCKFVFKVLVHDPKVEPLVMEMGIMVHPGTETNLVIKKTKVSFYLSDCSHITKMLLLLALLDCNEASLCILSPSIIK